MAQIHEAIAAIMGEVGAIKKGKINSGQGYMFRGIDDVYLAIHDLFVKHGVFSVPTVMEERTEDRTTKNGAALIYRVLRIKYEFFARDGSSVSAVVVGEGMDSGDKASNKAMSVAHKYAILQLLAIPTEDTIDPETESHEVAPPRAAWLPPAPRIDATDPRIAFIKETLREICPVEEEYDALKKEVWHKHNGDLNAILKDLEGRQISMSGRKAS